MHSRNGRIRSQITCLVLLLPILTFGCGAVDALDDSAGNGAAFAWNTGADDVILKVFRQSGITRGRRVFTLYGSGELRMERYTSNYKQKIEERSLWLSDDEVRSLLQGAVESRLPQWTGEKLKEPPIRKQIPVAADSPYLEIHISLSHYPPLGRAVDHVVGFPVETLRDVAPVLETFDEVLAAWELESTLRGLWEKAGTGS